MKRIFLAIVILSVALTQTLTAQDDPDVESMPEGYSTVIDADNPGMGLLDQATDAKLRASTVADLSQVILLCKRAKRAGLSGENLKYCNQLLATAQLQRGDFLAQELEKPGARTGNWQEIRRRALIDLEEAVSVIKDQPSAYLRIAQLNLLPGGNVEQAKEALMLAIQNTKEDQALHIQAVLLLANLEPEPEERVAVLAKAAKNGNPRVVLLHAIALLELKQNNEARNVLKQLAETEAGNTELHRQIIAILADFREYESTLSILDALREKSTDNEKQQIDLERAEIFAKMERYEEALELLRSLSAETRENRDLSLLILRLRAAVHLLMDNLADALNDIEAAEKIYSDFPPVLELKYTILVEQENYGDALAVVKKLQSIDERPQNFLREILVLNEQGKFDDSVKIAQRLREQYPDDELAWVMVLVEIYSKQKDYDKALALAEKQLEEDPEELRWIAAKTQILSAQKRWDEVEKWLESLIQKDPDSQRLTSLLIGVFFDQKNYRAAKERIKPLLEKDPDDLDLLRIDSQLSISLGLHSDAVKVLTKVVESDPEDYTSINNLAWILCTSPIDSVRNGPRAVELAERAGKMTNYKRAFVLSTLAAAYAEAGDFEKARELSQKSVEVAKTEKGKTDEEREELLEHLKKEWDCFEQNMPFRELMEEE